MKVLKSWLQDHIVEPLPPTEDIVNAFTEKSSEIEGVEEVTVLGKSDTVFDLKVLPDRAHYMLSHRGVAGELALLLNLTLKPQSLSLPHRGDDVKVSVESKLCRRNTATLITSITNTTSPEWLKARLEAIGARSINAIVDATNYGTFDTGQPLHAFDYDKVQGNLCVRTAHEGESIETLDGKNISLKPWHLVIADDRGPLDIAGIKGGKRAEVTLETKNIILESANFDPALIRKTSFEVGIRNDASKRFENEITPHLVEYGVSHFLNTLRSFSPLSVVHTMSDVYDSLPAQWNISVSHTHIEKILSIQILTTEVIRILEKLGCTVSESSGVYTITPPYERLDLVIPEDIIDEIGRIYGLNNIKSIVPHVKTNHIFSQEFLLMEKIKDVLCQEGYDEIQTRSFGNKGDIEVAYPMASDKSFLRKDLKSGIVSSLELATKNAPLLGLDSIRIFEIGKTFPKTGEQLDLSLGISHIKKVKNKDQVIHDEYTRIITLLEKGLGIKLATHIDSNILFITNLEQLKTSLTPQSISYTKGSRIQFVPFSLEPFIVRDVALFVPTGTSLDVVGKYIHDKVSEKAGTLLVKGPELFDQFEKEGKISLAFRMVFQAEDRTLTDIETNTIMDSLYESLRSQGWQVR